MQIHWKNCQQFPVTCTNNCGETKIPRKEVRKKKEKESF